MQSEGFRIQKVKIVLKLREKELWGFQDLSNLEGVGSDPGNTGSLFQSLSCMEGVDLAGVQRSGDLLGISF